MTPSDESSDSSTVVITDTDFSPPRGQPFPIVGIGASAGGLEAFAQLLSSLPAETGMAFVLVQHLDPQHPSLLTELLAPSTSMAVLTVQDGMAIEPNKVYVIPPNCSMELREGVLRLADREPGLHLPIDIFFRSLAKVQGSRAIGVVLSGNASDGSLGLRAIKAECGLTFAQDEASSRFSGMPRNAVATGAVDFVLPPAQIGKELGTIGYNPFLIARVPGHSDTETLPDSGGDLQRVFALLDATTKVDFAHYKPTTIRRRIGRRMMVRRIEQISEYSRYAEQHPPEIQELYRDLLISVTNFFRDPPVFQELARLMEKVLSRTGQSNQAIRAWVPGCATGEEVYSLAILLHELLQSQQLSCPIQIFGTDISEMALEKARHGLYPASIAVDVSPERLHRYFSKVDGGYQINKLIRECCIFARHDVIRDPPFSNVDLVSCRNVLIYLNDVAQRRVFPAFHYALKPTGLLVLGSAETTAAAPNLFAAATKQLHIFSRRDVPTKLHSDLSVRSPASTLPAADNRSVPIVNQDWEKRMDRVIQSKYSPDAVLISSEFQILHFRGDTSHYFNSPHGEAGVNLLRTAREHLVVPLRRAVESALDLGLSTRETVTSASENGTPEEVTIEVTPIVGRILMERMVLVAFLRNWQAPFRSPTVRAPNDGDGNSDSHRELAESREHLRNLTEEYEAYSEELRAANEEARSANEELQSTNEELGTTKEELQSANEELTTVNEELHNRNQELGAINSDLRNLLSAVTVAIVMVDQDLRLRRFNNSAEKLLNLGPLDVGRPVGHLRGKIETPKLEQQIQAVIASLNPLTEDVQDLAGTWYSIGVRPYRTVDDRIAGAVITFQDIDPLKRGLQAAEEARDYARGMIETVREPLVVLDSDLRIQSATSAFYETFLVSREETEGRFLYDLGNGQWNNRRLRERLGAALFRSEPFHDLEITHDFPTIGRRTMRLNARKIPRPTGERPTLLLAVEDVTERQEIAEIRFQRLFETAKDGIVVVDVETNTIQDINPFVLELTGLPREEFVGKRFEDVERTLRIADPLDVIKATAEQEIVRYEDVVMTSNDCLLSIDIVANRYLVGSQAVVQLNIRDTTARKQAMMALRESEERFRLFVESVRDYALFQLDKDVHIVSWNTGAERLLGWKEEEVIGKPGEIIFVPEDIASGAAAREIESTLEHGQADDNRWHLRKDGSRFFANGVMTKVTDDSGAWIGFAKIMHDVSAQREAEERLRRSVEEKSMLVREIHHRVKNNLQVIVSLLSLQSAYSNDPRVLEAFEETEGRVRAIAHIHERLYSTDDLAEVEVATYLTQLARELLALHATEPDRITLKLDVTDMVLHIEQAVPLGLIANELIVNALKHGLKGSVAGYVRVSLQYVGTPSGNDGAANQDEGWAEVKVTDSGPGLPAGFEASQTSSMGFRLINLLVRQLRGRLEIEDGPGASIRVIFPITPP